MLFGSRAGALTGPSLAHLIAHPRGHADARPRRDHHEGERQFIDGFPDETARGRLREGVSPESAAALFQAVLNGLQLQWVLDQDLDIVGPVTDFVRLLFGPDDTADAG
ncbi:hypothetical protein [Streptomyces sp. B1-3]|uniref:hypothetical protein n=1 Tax=Streptomyces sp. B1-3 TaxID=3141453 RepID=UPI003D274510